MVKMMSKNLSPFTKDFCREDHSETLTSFLCSNIYVENYYQTQILNFTMTDEVEARVKNKA